MITTEKMNNQQKTNEKTHSCRLDDDDESEFALEYNGLIFERVSIPDPFTNVTGFY